MSSGFGPPRTIRVPARDRLMRASSSCWVAWLAASTCVIATFDRSSTPLRVDLSAQKPSASIANRKTQNTVNTPSRPDASLIFPNMGRFLESGR